MLLPSLKAMHAQMSSALRKGANIQLKSQAPMVVVIDDWLDAADEILGVDLVEDLVVSLPDIALRDALADALEERGRPLDQQLWINDVF